MTLTDKQAERSRQGTADCSDLRALFINCTLKRSPELSHTDGLARQSLRAGNRRQENEFLP